MSEAPEGSGVPEPTRAHRQWLRNLARIALGSTLIYTGIGHLTFLRQEFRAQVPAWLPLDPDVVVVVSGFVEIALGAALVLAPRHRVLLGWVAAGFFVAVFPGNVAQYLQGTDGFGLDSDAERLARLFLQPLFIVWALWSTGAWHAWRARRNPLVGRESS